MIRRRKCCLVAEASSSPTQYLGTVDTLVDLGIVVSCASDYDLWRAHVHLCALVVVAMIINALSYLGLRSVLPLLLCGNQDNVERATSLLCTLHTSFIPPRSYDLCSAPNSDDPPAYHTAWPYFIS